MINSLIKLSNVSWLSVLFKVTSIKSLNQHFFTLPMESGLCSLSFLSEDRWMRSISPWVWLLTGLLCTPHCLDSLSTVWRTAPATNRQLNLCSSQSSSAVCNVNPGWTECAHSGPEKHDLSTLNSFFLAIYAAICLSCGDPVWCSTSKPEGWPHGESSCHCHSRRS